MAGASTRTLLRDGPDEASLVLRAPVAEDGEAGDQRYQVIGEIARGGVGVIYKSRDSDLGRDVALKVLRRELADRPAILERFVEEAQICGQLQHPGIVPVYGMGIQPDERPYIAMKLVRGKTLAMLLDGRASPGIDRRRFLTIFARVCQTIAYAHARGVMHRDLKPANVMTGAFGEVQVMDWGFAKVIGRTEKSVGPVAVETPQSDQARADSLAGNVMGTPAYMPPEQALGSSDRVDARSDVFALGAILCEILTGEPPYGGEPREQLLAAAQCQLEQAALRLERCGAEEELVQLAFECLAADRGDRPPHAGVLAKRIDDYLADADERTRARELEGIEARAQAEAARERAVHEQARVEEERARELAAQQAAEWAKTTRRRTLAVAACLLIATLLGGGGYLWYTQSRRDQQEETARVIDQAMLRANFFHGQDRLAEAIASARHAVVIARNSELAPEQRTQAEAQLAALEREAANAEAARRQNERNEAMLGRVDAIRDRYAADGDAALAEREYAEAFRFYGVDPTGPVAAAAAQLHAGGTATDLAAALDDWARLRRRAPELADTDWRALDRIARAADPDPWRNELRDAAAEGNALALRQLAGSADLTTLGAPSLLLLGKSLAAAGDPTAAIEFLRRAHLHHPEDFWIGLTLARDLQRHDPGGSERVRYQAAAVALRPRTGALWASLGSARLDAGDRSGAIDAFRRALALDPKLAGAHNLLGSALRANGDAERATDSIAAALRIEPENVGYLLNLAHTHVAAGRLDLAIPLCRRVATLDRRRLDALATVIGRLPQAADARTTLAQRAAQLPDDSFLAFSLALVTLRAGDAAAAEALLAPLAKREPDQPLVRVALARAWLALGRADEALAQLELATRADPRNAGIHRALGRARAGRGDFAGAAEALRLATRFAPDSSATQTELGIALYRAGRFAEADSALRRGALRDPVRRVYLAMTHARLGRPNEAQRLLDDARGVAQAPAELLAEARETLGR